MKEITLDKTFFDEFRKWLRLNLEAVTWQGRFTEEFEQFWSLFFVEGLSVSQLSNRFNAIVKVAKVGPLIAWFNWLKHRFHCFLFIKYNISILELSRMTDSPPRQTAAVIRDFLIEQFPHLEDYFNDRLQVGNLASENIKVSFETIQKEVALNAFPLGSIDDEILTSMEVTLFGEWADILKHLKKDFFVKGNQSQEEDRKERIRAVLKMVGEAVLLTAVGFLLIFLVKGANKWYEGELVKKIGIYEPKMLWLDKELKYKETVDESVVPEKLSPEFEEIEDIASRDIPDEYAEEERFDVESEVTLTSWDSLPRDFEAAGREQSEYEEVLKGGFRDTRFGNKKVFRVMMKTVNAFQSRTDLNQLIEKYQVEKGDQVQPGTFVPGGIYYNLFVPREYLKEFLAQVMDTGESILYESRTRGRNPPGKNKVFIWIKNI